MAKKFKKMMSMVLVLCMMVSMMAVPAFAAEEPVVETEAVEGGQVVTTTTTETDENGNTTVTVKIETDTTKTDANGVKETLDIERIEETITNADGNVISENWVEDGVETKEWTEDVKPGQEVPEVEATVTGTDENGNLIISGSAASGPVTKVEGDTTTTTTTNREVNGTVKVEEEFVINGEESTLECPVASEDYEGKGYYDGYQEGEIRNYRDGLLDGTTKDMFEGSVNDKPDTEGYEKGYDVTWTGVSEYTDGAVAVYAKGEIKYIPEYVKDENGEYVLDEEGNKIIALDEDGNEIPYLENGKKVVDMERTEFVVGKNGRQLDYYGQGTGMVTQTSQFVLKHENGEYFYAYCMDASTGANPTLNKWYNIRNLEDAIESEDNPDGYITEEEAGMIRAIVSNGYWGAESGRGSVDAMKDLLKANYNEESKIYVRYPGSNEPHEYSIYELIDGLTEHEALAVTQAAIWTFANNQDMVYNQGSFGGLVTDGSVVSVLSAFKYNGSDGNPSLNEYEPVKDGESDARLQALYQCLLGLEPIYADGELREDSTVIPNEGVISDVAIVVQDKVEDEAANLDENKDNDVYNTSVNFKLAFVPGENDEMYVLLLDGNNQPILGEDGQPVKKLLVSETSEKSGDDVLKPVGGVYTLSGLKVSENSDFEFDLRLEGTQYLNEGVYIYQAEGGRRESQTLVGLAKGEQKIEVSTKLTINFNVDEENNVVAQRVWHDEGDPAAAPAVAAANFAVPARPLDTIPDEEVPLADAPQTGDEAIIFAFLTVLAGMSLMAMHVSEKKRKEEI